MLKTTQWGFLLFIFILLSACSAIHSGDGPPDYNVDVSRIPNAVPKAEPYSKFGNPSSYVVLGHRYYVMRNADHYEERGIASWYGTKFHKHRTSSGEPYNMLGMTAASRTLPLPTYARVTNLENGRWVIVKVNDRGPFDRHRIMDLSYVAAKKLGMLGHGTAYVDIKAINARSWNPFRENTSSSYSDSTSNSSSGSSSSPGAKPTLYLQVGSFMEYENALSVQNRVKNMTYASTHIERTYVNHQSRYRVEIGPIASVNLSDEICRNVERAGLGTPIPVIE